MAQHRRDELWRANGFKFPVATVYWLYPTGKFTGGFVRRVNRMWTLGAPIEGVELLPAGGAS